MNRAITGRLLFVSGVLVVGLGVSRSYTGSSGFSMDIDTVPSPRRAVPDRSTTSLNPSVARRVVPSTIGIPVSVVNEKPGRQKVARVDVPIASVGSVEVLGKDMVLVNGSAVATVDRAGLLDEGVIPTEAGPIVAATAGQTSSEAVVVSYPYSDLLEVWKVRLSARDSWESMGTIPLAAYTSWSAKVASDGREIAVLIGWAHGGHSEAELFQMKPSGWDRLTAPAFGSFATASGRLFIGASEESGAPGWWSFAGKAPWTRVDSFGPIAVRILPESGLGAVSVQTEDGVVSTLDSGSGFRIVKKVSGSQSVDPNFGLPDAATAAASRVAGSSPIRSGYLRNDGTGVALAADGTFLLTSDGGLNWRTLKLSPNIVKNP